jgi:hypothetical protein
MNCVPIIVVGLKTQLSELKLKLDIISEINLIVRFNNDALQAFLNTENLIVKSITLTKVRT